MTDPEKTKTLVGDLALNILTKIKPTIHLTRELVADPCNELSIEVSVGLSIVNAAIENARAAGAPADFLDRVTATAREAIGNTNSDCISVHMRKPQ